jgi:hypothetical protein
MKVIKSVFFIFLLILLGYSALAQVGIQTDTPDPSSELEIFSSNKGLLIPRITLTSNLFSPTPVTAPATGLLIFNSGVNQPMGLYYWNGSQWVATSSSSSTNNWFLTGNSGTSIASNFLGTTDNQHFAMRTNNTERLRIESDGHVLIGTTTPLYDSDLFTVLGDETYYSAINAYSPNGFGVYSGAGSIAFLGDVDHEDAFGLWVTNADLNGYGAIIVGSDAGAYTLENHTAGLSCSGSDGIFCSGKSATGIGIIAGGNDISTFSTIDDGAGGAFTGYHGIYAKGISSGSGIGVIGVGNNEASYSTSSDGSGGAFTGYHGIFSKGTNRDEGTGVIGIGNDGSYYLDADGSGGAFTGELTGVSAWATLQSSSAVGVYGAYQGGGSRDGVGVYGYAYNTTNGRGYGVYGSGSRYGVYANGNLGASGIKSFAIDHPLDPQNKILKHYSIESPEVLNMYRGNVTLNQYGEASIALPDYFTAININFSYSLTPVGQSAPNLFIKQEIDENGMFLIAGGHPDQKISWIIYAERNDPYMQQHQESKQVVVEKDIENRGKYIMPELYNQPESSGIFYRNNNVQVKSTESHSTKELTTKQVSPGTGKK